MKPIKCQQCGTKIRARHLNRQQGSATCPKCKATFSLTGELGAALTEPMPKQLTVPLPSNFRVEQSSDELKIIIRWFTPKLWMPTLLCLFLDGLVAVFVAALIAGAPRMSGEDLGVFIIAPLILTPFILLGGVLTYYVLAGYINRTVVKVNRRVLEVKHTPLPVPSGQQIEAFLAFITRSEMLTGMIQFAGNSRFDSTQIKQVSISEKIMRGKDWTNYSYNVRIMNQQGKIETILTSLLTTSDQALYLEQEIERHLGIPDHEVLTQMGHDSADPAGTHQQKSWRKLASANHLQWIARTPLKGSYICGEYRGYYLELDSFTKKEGEQHQTYTRLLLAANQPPASGQPSQPLTLAELTSSLARLSPEASLKGTIKVEAGGQKIYYEQTSFETEANYLQFLFESLSDLLTAYPQLVALGGTTVPTLQAILAQPDHPLQPAAVQLLAEIAQETTNRWAERSSRLRCARCFDHCVAQPVNLSPFKTLTYYGCRVCLQSQEFFEIEGRVIAVLDSRLEVEQPLTPFILIQENGGELREIRGNSEIPAVPLSSSKFLSSRVNWLARRTLFTFDEVEIVRATDEEVERFVVQVGNDTDPMRRSRYQTMACRVGPDCDLSENTTRILQRTFGQVEVGR